MKTYALIRDGLLSAVVSTNIAPEGPAMEVGAGVTPQTHYFDGAQVRQKGTPPTDAHVWRNGWVIDIDILVAAIRAERARLLAASDWTQLPDVPLATKTAWAAYRQALRDITDQPDYPDRVDWPVAPASSPA